MNEFELIRHFFQDRDVVPPEVIMGIGDDCAIISPPENHQLCLSIDTLVEGTHFLPGADPASIAGRAIGSCISDLAAMGAQPSHYTLALTLPGVNETWLNSFSKRLLELGKRYDMVLVGGDTTRGPLAVSIQVHGWVPTGAALTRNGAKEGDAIYVSGCLGDAAAGLLIERGLHRPQSELDKKYLLERFHYPSPRTDLGQSIRDIANACIDISDGLIADLRHILRASEVGAEVDLSSIPISKSLHAGFERSKSLELAMSGGDDYELLFTVSPENEGALAALSLGCSVVKVGVICEGTELVLIGEDDRILDQFAYSKEGYKHFD